MADPGGPVRENGFDGPALERMVVMASGVTWDGPWLVEKHLARAVSRHAPVLFRRSAGLLGSVDPPPSAAGRHLAMADAARRRGRSCG